MTDVLIRYLKEAEGEYVHYNDSEADITTMCGIYREEHGDAEVFNAIDDIARRLDMTLPTSSWDDDDLDKFNAYLEDNQEEYDTLLNLVGVFYDDFISNAHLDEFPGTAQVAMFSLYTNSPLRAWKSVQTAINHMVDNEWITLPNDKLVVDGGYGGNTADAIDRVRDLTNDNPLYGYLFEAYIVSAMSTQYARIVANNPDKYLRYLNGWNNRLENLLSIM